MRIDAEDPDREDGQRLDRLLDEAGFITQGLEPIMRVRFRHDPAKLAEWDEVMHMCDDLEEGDYESSRLHRHLDKL
jgi:hypothetical protein